jgi:hypothetical protein
MTVTTLNDQQNLIVTKATGSLTAVELLRFVNEVWAPARAPVLFDAVDASIAQITAEDIRKLADTATTLRRTSGLSAKLAIAAAADVDFGLARMFQSFADVNNGGNVRVFRSVTEAVSWLT